MKLPSLTEYSPRKSLLFSLVAFARRPLHLSELKDAMTLALSDPSKEPNPLQRPNRLKVLFPPLIEIQDDPNEPDNPLCRLCHSTVHSFLTSNPHILCPERSMCNGARSCEHLISPTTFGHLCLRYFSQPRFNELLPIEEGFLRDADSLLLYFAKFWTKHLEDMDATPDGRKAVATFANSSNFQTLVQIQSLTVAGQFEQVPFGPCTDEEALAMGRDGYHHLQRQCFPKWLLYDKNTVFKEYVPYRGQYRHFVNEWGYLLTRATSPSDQDYFPGEVDRCLSGMMGPSSFLSHMKERYSSFMLSQEPFDCTMTNSRVLVERLSPAGDRFTVVSLLPRYVLTVFFPG